MKKKRNDLLFAAAVLSIAAVLFLYQRLGGESGPGVVKVYREKEILGVYPLSEERTETFTGEEGSFNRLVIQNKKAFIEDADCPDKLCVKQGKISRNKEALTCLPHRLSVVIEKGEASLVDAVVR